MSKITLKVEIDEETYKQIKGDSVCSNNNECIISKSSSAYYALNAIINATPITECDDAVSRQAVLDEFKDGTEGYDCAKWTRIDIIDVIEALPPVLPKRNIVNCENFKFDEWDIGDKKAELWVIKGRLQIRYEGTIHNVDFPVLPKREYCPNCGVEMR